MLFDVIGFIYKYLNMVTDHKKAEAWKNMGALGTGIIVIGVWCRVGTEWEQGKMKKGRKERRKEDFSF
jgi:hypothetical protein